MKLVDNSNIVVKLTLDPPTEKSMEIVDTTEHNDLSLSENKDTEEHGLSNLPNTSKERPSLIDIDFSGGLTCSQCRLGGSDVRLSACGCTLHTVRHSRKIVSFLFIIFTHVI